MEYTVVLTFDEEDGVYSASVPALPGCHTWGETEEEAYKNAEDAIATHIEALRKLDLPVPKEIGKKVIVAG